MEEMLPDPVILEVVRQSDYHARREESSLDAILLVVLVLYLGGIMASKRLMRHLTKKLARNSADSERELRTPTLALTQEDMELVVGWLEGIAGLHESQIDPKEVAHMREVVRKIKAASQG